MEKTKQVVICTAVFDGEKMDLDHFTEGFHRAFRKIAEIHGHRDPIESSVVFYPYVFEDQLKVLRMSHKWKLSTLINKLRRPLG